MTRDVMTNAAAESVSCPNTHSQLDTIFPITAPVQTMLRLGVSDVPSWQIVASIGVLGLSIVVGLLLSIKIFRVHMLMHGKRPGFRDIMRSLKDA